MIDGDDSFMSAGILSISSRDNVTIKNFRNITDFMVGIMMVSNNNIKLYNLSVESNTGDGMELSVSNNNINFTNITVRSNGGKGLQIDEGRNVRIENITSISNSLYGVTCEGCDDVLFKNIISSLNTYGIFVSGYTNGTTTLVLDTVTACSNTDKDFECINAMSATADNIVADTYGTCSAWIGSPTACP